ncbi:MAG: aminotransferase class V-fold PLP-dependent enzyme [Clostridia bacterium]|nr:aminotransferase class V-fold PLP-dependent enzyme [Clostridia bacterium]
MKDDRMETPIYTKLKEYHKKNRIPFAMPGHKNGRGLAADLKKCDVTELAATVDLHGQSPEVTRANELLSELYGSDKSFIMTGGSTEGVQAMLSSVLTPGDTLLAGADCHVSVINTCALCGFRLRLVPIRYDEEFCIPTANEDFEITPDIKAVLMTSPNYYGIAKDIKGIAEKCHAAGVPLLVDEAHGAHFGSPMFSGLGDFPKSAVRYADMVCQSAHKTLNALTGAAYLHIKEGLIDIKRVKRALASFGTSSPSYPIAASADIARAELEYSDYGAIIEKCVDLEFDLEKLDIKVLENDDITRVVIGFSEYELTGFEVARRLSDKYGIDVEMADMNNIVLIATPWNKALDFAKLTKALGEIVGGAEKRSRRPMILPPPVTDTVVSPSCGWYAETELVPLEEATDRIAATTITAYPPGTAIVVTGERIRNESIEYIKKLINAGAQLKGISGDKAEVVKWTG